MDKLTLRGKVGIPSYREEEEKVDSVTVNVGGQSIGSGIKEKAKLLSTPVGFPWSDYLKWECAHCLRVVARTKGKWKKETACGPFAFAC